MLEVLDFVALLVPAASVPCDCAAKVDTDGINTAANIIAMNAEMVKLVIFIVIYIYISIETVKNQMVGYCAYDIKLTWYKIGGL